MTGNDKRAKELMSALVGEGREIRRRELVAKWRLFRNLEEQELQLAGVNPHRPGVDVVRAELAYRVPGCR